MDHPPTPDLSGFTGKPVVALGVDAIEIDRITRALKRSAGFESRLFSADERAYCNASVNPGERFAARFAAKEATLKALGVGLGGADFVEIELLRTGEGPPSLRVTGRAAVLAQAAGIDRWLVSISHSDTVAVAVVAGLAAP